MKRDPHRARAKESLDGITVNEKPWTYSAFIAQLHDAERAAGIEPRKWKVAHAFRRGVAGDVLSLTGSERRAAEWIGDKDVKVVKRSYLLERDEELQRTATAIGSEE
mgnify:CR=1 FL=1